MLNLPLAPALPANVIDPTTGTAPGVMPARYSVAGLPLLRQGLAGAVAGLLVFLLSERGIRATEMGPFSLESFFSGMLLGVLFGGLVGGLIAAADELSSGSPVRILLRGAAAAVVGAVAGTVLLFVANTVYIVLGLLGGMITQIASRALGWAIFGVGASLGAGLVTRSGRRLAQACVGGAVGGFIGGVLFDLLALLTGDASLSRLVGLTVIGACVGFATALVEQLAKTAWVFFLTGSREGRQVVLHREKNTLGRDELADLPLFGDPSVARRHAILTLVPEPAILELATEPLMRVDGHLCREARLADGALVEIGRHRFRFHHRLVPMALPADLYAGMQARQRYPVPSGATAAVPAPYAGEVTVMPGAAEPVLPEPAPLLQPGQELVLRITTGAAAGATWPLMGSGLTIGRDIGNTLLLADSKVSRFHVRIERLDQAWVLVDLGSTNGTRLNGVRVTRAGLAQGDFLYVGDTVIAVEAQAVPSPSGRV